MHGIPCLNGSTSLVLVDLALATICFAGQCYPALVGPDTPRGQFQLTHAQTPLPGYGGDVLMFKEDSKYIYAIHRVWTLNPKQRRLERLQSGDPYQRQTITMGCINIMPSVYELLVDCCSNQQLTIK
jgi:hypothetical protein